MSEWVQRPVRLRNSENGTPFLACRQTQGVVEATRGLVCSFSSLLLQIG